MLLRTIGRACGGGCAKERRERDGHGRRWPRRKQLAMWTEVVGPDRSTVRPEVVAPDRLAVRPDMAVPKAAGCVDEGGGNNILSSNNA